ncbi:MAG: transglutaminase domain-containing protein [Candidatus Aenigmatarchaeota archaeon]
MKKIFFIISILLIISNYSFAQTLNPKSIVELKLKIIRSGYLSTNNVEKMNLSIYIPQENIESIDIFTDGGTWKYIYDKFGNKIVLLEWRKPKGIIKYSVETIVKNSAKHLSYEKQIGSDSDYLKETETIVFTDELKKVAYPYEKTLKKVSELTNWVNKYMTYDISYTGKNLPSDKVFLERHGVCVEYSNLLTTLLRINGIPTRYVVGYAYSSVQNKFIGHAWVEVLANDGSWIPFDPTWLQGGYLDATHIKTANLLDNSQVDTLSYVGDSVDWQKNDEEFDILDYKTKNIISIEMGASERIASNENGYLKVYINSNECAISELTASSCVDLNKNKMFIIYDANRILWNCNSQELYWFFTPTNKNKYYYVCPVIVYDQIGTSKDIDIEIIPKKKINDIDISGPNIVRTNEQFRLIANTLDEFIFYSPDFGEHKNKIWDISINKPGTYKFYLYSNGALSIKNITVLEKKEFDIKIDAPNNITLKNSFFSNIIVKNLLDKEKIVDIKLEFDNYTLNDIISLKPSEEKIITYNLTANYIGNRKIQFSIFSDTLITYSSSIYVYEIKKKSWIDDIFDLFSNVIKWFSWLF